MINAEKLTRVNELVQQARSSVIFVRSQPNIDQVLSAFALKTSLEAKGITVEIACADLGNLSNSVDDSFFENTGLNLESIHQKIGNKNLTISFPYDEGAVENVSYHISEDSSQFYLTIKPAPGATPLDSQQVEFDYAGLDADIAIIIGVHDWEQLDYLYSTHEKFFADTPIISIHTFQNDLTPLQLDTSSFGSMCEGLVWIIEGIQLNVTPQGATSLLKGVELATDHFRSLSTTADTFESVAKLMRAGARRTVVNKEKTPVANQVIRSEQPSRTSDSTSKRLNNAKKNLHIQPKEKLRG
jgi:nanoRNase/pAp phosphatase (c-di-AMP/oligoRNAs hydrolase)